MGWDLLIPCDSEPITLGHNALYWQQATSNSCPLLVYATCTSRPSAQHLRLAPASQQVQGTNLCPRPALLLCHLIPSPYCVCCWFGILAWHPAQCSPNWSESCSQVNCYALPQAEKQHPVTLCSCNPSLHVSELNPPSMNQAVQLVLGSMGVLASPLPPVSGKNRACF